MTTTQIAIEDAILEHLQPLTDMGITVRKLPDKPNEAGKVAENGVITLSPLTAIQSLGTSADRSVQPVLQLVTLDGRVKKMRSEGGVLRIQPELQKLLGGFRPPKAGALRFQKFEMTKRDDVYWIFQAEYRFPMLMS